MKVLMTGGTGLIGRELGKALVNAGHNVFLISRGQKSALSKVTYPCQVIEADLNRGPSHDPRLDSVEVVIHLAGENVGAGRWTVSRKENIYASRVNLTKNLLISLNNNKALKVSISAGAIGIYGNRENEILNEESKAGTGFLAEVCSAWESAVREGQSVFPKARFVVLRAGVVMSSSDGALGKMIQPFRWGVGGVLGNGRQWLSWIHIQDLVKIYLWALENSAAVGGINAVSPNPVTNREITCVLASILEKWVGPTVPAFVLRALLGEMSSLILNSARVEPRRLLSAGFRFEFPEIEGALQSCLR